MRPTLKFQIAALTPILLFIVLKGIIYWLYPIHSFEEWLQVDFIKNIPRILCTGIAYLVAKKFLDGTDWNIFRSRGWKLSLQYLALILCFSWINGFWNPPQDASGQEILIIGLDYFQIILYS